MDDRTEILISATSEIGATYDRACKTLMLNKEILAPILKNVVPEFKDCTIAEVIDCIDATSITSDPVDDISVLAERSEMSSLSDKLVVFDAHFRTRNPILSTETITIFLHIDMEVQNNYKPSNPSYPVIKRGIYYAARELGSQLGILTENTDYSKLEKVYSIWICNDNIPKPLQNTVTEYAITKKDIIGSCNEPEKDYDLMQVILIRRGNDDGIEAIFDYLTGVFTSNLEKIKKYVDIDNNEKIREEVIKMSGLGQSIAAKSMQQGIKSFIELCKEFGQTVSETVARVIDKFGTTPEEADELVKKYW